MRRFKKLTLTTALFSLIFILFTLTGQAADTGVVSVSTWLNLRSEPSLSASVLAKIPNDTTVNINGISGSWYLLNYQNQSGYAHSDFIMNYTKEETQPETQTQESTSVVGYVRADGGLNLRNSPFASAPVVTLMPDDSLILILSADGYWYKIAYGNYTGFAHSAYIATDAAEEQISKETVLYGYISSGSGLNLRSTPSESSSRITVIPYAAQVEILSSENGWDQVRYGTYTGYVSGSYITRTPILADRSSSTARELSADGQALAENLVEYAKQFLGVRYVYGGSTPSGFDCSGYVKYVYAHFGITLPRTASTQAASSLGTPVSKADLMPGDLVFFRSPSVKSIEHVGIYVGNGQFIHASSPGDYVKYTALSSSYYTKYYMTARRIIQ